MNFIRITTPDGDTLTINNNARAVAEYFEDGIHQEFFTGRRDYMRYLVSVLHWYYTEYWLKPIAENPTATPPSPYIVNDIKWEIVKD